MISEIRSKTLRGTINGIPGTYTVRGWMLDYGARAARAVIIDTDKIGNELRKLRMGDTVELLLAIEEGEELKIEYDGMAEVQMVRFRASRNELPHFRTQFKLTEML